MLEHVRVPPIELPVGAPKHPTQANTPLTLAHHGEEQRGVEDVAELFFVVAAGPAGRGDHLPDFLDQMGQERAGGLGAVPGTSPRPVEATREGREPPKRIQLGGMRPAWFDRLWGLCYDARCHIVASRRHSNALYPPAQRRARLIRF